MSPTLCRGFSETEERQRRRHDRADPLMAGSTGSTSIHERRSNPTQQLEVHVIDRPGERFLGLAKPARVRLRQQSQTRLPITGARIRDLPLTAARIKDAIGI